MSWIGVDLDGTLAYDTGWKGTGHIGDPIPLMIARVQDHLAAGHEVRIFTARVSCAEDLLPEFEAPIKAFCQTHFGRVLPITCTKDFAALLIYDDRVVQVEPNTGRTLEDILAGVRAVIDAVEHNEYDAWVGLAMIATIVGATPMRTEP